MIAILVVFGLVGLFLLAFGERLGRSAFVVAALAPVVSTAWVGAQLADVIDGRVVSEHVSWVGGLGLSLDLRLDGFAATMTLIISAIGVLVMVYAASYFSSDTPYLGRLAGLLVLFAGAMVGLVQSDHLLLLYTCWEITSITSYLLIGNDHDDADARAAALHALLVTSAGGLAMLGGFVLLAHEAGTYRLSELATGPVPTGAAVTVALVLVLLGAFTKSAQYPFHAWLPGAMAAPTPVSAYLHSATMVKAGVYLIARLAPIFAATAVWRPAVLVVGLATLVAGGLRALRQHDLKLLLAFATVSQLGLMVVLFGAGTPEATTAGWVLLVAHALFKAALFMVVGILDHQTTTRDIERLTPLGRGWWWVEATAAVSCASMAGVPLAAGFIAKEAAYGAFADGSFVGSGFVLGATVGGSMLTVAYATRFYWGAFVAPRRRAREGIVRPPAPSWVFVAPAAVLAVASIGLGLAPQIVDRLASAAVRSIDASAEAVQLSLWHGFNLALALSTLTLAGGWLLAVSNRRAQQLLATGAAVPPGEAVYLVLLRALSATSRWVTGVVQNGSLSAYSGVILATAAVLPAGMLLRAWDWPDWPAFGAIGDLPIAGMLVVAAFGAATVRRRFSAAVFLGATGYAMAGLFVVYGAPDLALTQVAVETLTTVVFVLVLRQLPERFERQSSSGRRVVRLGVAGLVGAVVFMFAIVAGGSRMAAPVSEEMVVRAATDGHGRNVVNVILVDFRALDTLGEITVLAAASIGAVALARVGRRTAVQSGEPAVARSEDGISGTADRRGSRMLGGSAAETEALSPALAGFADGPLGPRLRLSAQPLRRIVFVDVSVRVTFHAVLMASLWLLFAGHNEPGGGFVGGLLAGSAIALRYIAGGMSDVRGRSRFRPWTVLGVGLLLAVATATFPLLGGGAVLDAASGSIALPLLGTARLSSTLVFDTGVYLTVVGMVLMAFEAFGDEPLGAST